MARRDTVRRSRSAPLKRGKGRRPSPSQTESPAATPKRGRPSLGIHARSHSVLVRLTETEYAAIATAVAAENAELKRDGDEGSTTVSSWLRDHALDPLGLMPRDSAD